MADYDYLTGTFEDEDGVYHTLHHESYLRQLGLRMDTDAFVSSTAKELVKGHEDDKELAKVYNSVAKTADKPKKDPEGNGHHAHTHHKRHIPKILIS